MLLDLVGLRIDLAGSDDATASMMRELWPEFVEEPVTGSTDIELLATSDESVLAKGPAPEPRIERADARWDLLRHDFAGVWDARGRRATLRYGGTIASFSSFMRVLLSIVLRERGGVLFHAASVRAADGVVLFPGVSGTGKSTIAGLGAPRGVLSDEISALCPMGDDVIAFPTPFWGDLERARAAPSARLARIVLLARGQAQATLEPAPRAAAVATLLEAALSFDPLAPEEKRAFIDSIHALAARPACLRLRFDLPANPWPLIDP